METLEISSAPPAEDRDDEMSAPGLRKSFERHLRRTLARDRFSATDRDRYYALALTVRDQLIERWIATQQEHHRHNVKRVYYLSLEFLIGRMMGNNVINMQMEDICRKAMSQEGLDWEDLREYEIDAGLGNGGLGRLAACFMDSIATFDLPAVGYGLRYDFGIFKQNIKNGYQVEQPEEWLKHNYPWEISHPEFSFDVQFEGHVETRYGPRGPEYHWLDTKIVIGIPYDLPVVGYGGRTVNTLRLWSAKSAEEFGLDDFNRGEYVEAVANKVLAENLTKVLYPDDTVFAGKELRLKQEYFFVSCTDPGHPPPLQIGRQRLGVFCRQGFCAIERYAPCACHSRAHAPPDGSRGFGMGAGLAYFDSFNRLYQPHDTARGAREVVYPHAGAAASAPPADHL